MTDLVTLSDIEAAARRIAGHVAATPLLPFGATGVLLKAESLQPSGAFKLRGAFNALLSLDAGARARGVVAHSSGNHAIAVAYAARVLGIAATLVMPANAPAVKRDWVARLGARLESVGPASSERLARAAALAASEGLTLIEPYDSAAIIAGTGTIALEILDALGDTRAGPLALYVPVSGGGLIAGIAAAAKARDPSVRVIGVEPELAADAQASLRAGMRVEWPAGDVVRTLADGLRVQRVGALPWAHIERHVDDIVTVSEDEMLDAVRDMALDARLVVEPSGAVAPAAACLSRNARDRDDVRRVAVVSGGNVDPAVFRAALARG
jgi:threonine dehydratase